MKADLRKEGNLIFI